MEGNAEENSVAPIPKRNNFLNNSQNDLKALKILIGYSRWFGITPYSLKANSFERKFTKCIVCVLLILWVIYACYSYILEIHGTRDNLQFINFVSFKTMWSVSNLLVLITCVARPNLFQLTSWRKFFVILDEIEITMIRHGFQMTRNFYIICSEASVFIAIPIIIQIFQIAVLMKKIKSDVIFFCLDWTLPHFCTSFTVSLLRLLIKMLEKRFEYLNDTLKGLKDVDRKYALPEMRRILKVYQKLHLLIEEINAVFGCQMFMCVFLILIFSISFLSYSVILIPVKPHVVKIFVLFITSYLVTSITLITACESVEKTGKEIIKTCYDLHECSENHELREELLLSGKRLKQWRPIFSAAGFFSVNWKIIPALFWTIIIYTVAIVQINLTVAMQQKLWTGVNVSTGMNISNL